jgi:uncharacterized membrane protein YebE (DUF533 family)
MLRPDELVNGVLQSVFGGRGKRSHGALRFLTRRSSSLWANPATILTAAGVAWGIVETLTNKTSDPAAGPAAAPGTGGFAPGRSGSPGGPTDAASASSGAGLGSAYTTSAGVSGGSAVPPPIPTSTPATSASTGAPPAAPATTPGPDAMRLMRLAVSAAHADGPMNEHERAAILLEAKKVGIEGVFAPELTQPRPLAEIVAGVTDASARATLYVLAYTILRADEQVTGAERIYLAQLANLLALDRTTIEALEKDTGERIDALGDQGQLGG